MVGAKGGRSEVDIAKFASPEFGGANQRLHSDSIPSRRDEYNVNQHAILQEQSAWETIAITGAALAAIPTSPSSPPKLSKDRLFRGLIFVDCHEIVDAIALSLMTAVDTCLTTMLLLLPYTVASSETNIVCAHVLSHGHFYRFLT